MEDRDANSCEQIVDEPITLLSLWSIVRAIIEFDHKPHGRRAAITEDEVEVLSLDAVEVLSLPLCFTPHKDEIGKSYFGKHDAEGRSGFFERVVETSLGD